MPSLFSFLFWGTLSFSEKEDLIGVAMVVIGVLGEVFLEIASVWLPYNPTDFSQLDSILGCKTKHLEIIFVSLVAIGVGLELYALPKSLNESHTQIEALKNKTEELRKQNDELEITLKPRRIIAEQREKFIRIMSFSRNFSKIPIKVFVGKTDNETENFALQFREMLDEAGYGTNAKFEHPELTNYLFVGGFESNRVGVDTIPNIKVAPFNDEGKYEELIRNYDIGIRPSDVYYTGKEPQVLVLYSGGIPTSKPVGSIWPMYPTTNTTDTNPIYIYRPTQNSNEIIYGVSQIISDIGIRVAPLSGDEVVKSGEVGFLIPQKSY